MTTSRSLLGVPMAEAFDVVYLTGAPAAGKSTLAEQLKQVITPIEVFNYGSELTRYLESKTGQPITQEELRRQSSQAASPEDIDALDTILLKRVAEMRPTTNFVIDTHAVTKEAYGFRVTPFSLKRVGDLRPTKIVVLFTSPEVALKRIGTDSGGRPMITEFESGFHTGLQASVALSYGTSLGIPVYFLDSSKDLPELLDWFKRRLKSGGWAPRVALESGSGASVPPTHRNGT